jgi:hypothetical protein
VQDGSAALVHWLTAAGIWQISDWLMQLTVLVSAHVPGFVSLQQYCPAPQAPTPLLALLPPQCTSSTLALDDPQIRTA